jgi:hypothetical protein
VYKRGLGTIKIDGLWTNYDKCSARVKIGGIAALMWHRIERREGPHWRMAQKEQNSTFARMKLVRIVDHNYYLQEEMAFAKMYRGNGVTSDGNLNVRREDWR